jgi:hypothetical protein
MKLLDDTTPEARRVLIEVSRHMPLRRKLQLLDDAYRFGRSLHAAGCRLRNPHVTPHEIQADWIRHTAGDELARVFERSMNVQLQPPEQQRVIRIVIEAFEQMGIAYAVGGSQASSVHGIRRGTEDADITVEPFPGRDEEFASKFNADFYADAAMIRDAIRRRSSFNLLHLPTGFKVDVFIRKDRPFDLSVMSRRASVATEIDPQGAVYVSAEDIVLHKLEWFRLGGEISDRQWGDILGVLRVQGERLDNAYLDHWATELGVADLLQQAREQV